MRKFPLSVVLSGDYSAFSARIEGVGILKNLISSSNGGNRYFVLEVRTSNVELINYASKIRGKSVHDK